MKQFLLTASACIGLFAFTRVGGSHRQHTAATMGSYTQADTTKPKPDSIRSVVFTDTTKKPKPDSAQLVAFTDTTKKPKPDSTRAMAFLTDTTKKPKPDSISVAMR